MNTAFRPLHHEYDPDYWAQRFATEPYVAEGDQFDNFEPAYRFGHSLRGRISDFHECETTCENLWNETKEAGALTWDRVRLAVRSAWYRAQLFTGRANLNDALHRGEETVRAVWERCEEKVRRHPSGAVLGAAATGYLYHLLPVRSILLTGIRVVAAAAPSALLVLGMWRAVDFAFRESRGPGPQTSGDAL